MVRTLLTRRASITATMAIKHQILHKWDFVFAPSSLTAAETEVKVISLKTAAWISNDLSAKDNVLLNYLDYYLTQYSRFSGESFTKSHSEKLVQIRHWVQGQKKPGKRR